MLNIPCTLTVVASQQGHSIWDEAIKVTAWVLGIATGAAGAWKYLDQKKDAHAKDLLARRDALDKQVFEEARADATRRLEIRKPFSLKQQEVYFDLLNTTAILSNRTVGEPEWWTASNHFWILFWGVVPVVADEAVGAAVNYFSECLDDPGAQNGIPLRNASMDLARACRSSLGEAWASRFELAERTTQTRGSAGS